MGCPSIHALQCDKVAFGFWMDLHGLTREVRCRFENASLLILGVKWWRWIRITYCHHNQRQKTNLRKMSTIELIFLFPFPLMMIIDVLIKIIPNHSERVTFRKSLTVSASMKDCSIAFFSTYLSRHLKFRNVRFILVIWARLPLGKV